MNVFSSHTFVKAGVVDGTAAFSQDSISNCIDYLISSIKLKFERYK